MTRAPCHPTLPAWVLPGPPAPRVRRGAISRSRNPLNPMGAKRPRSATKKGEPLSVRAYARHRGCAPTAVDQAIRAGRLVLSIVRDEAGHPKIADPALADREWKASTRADMVPLSGPTAPRTSRVDGGDTPSLAVARARLDEAKAALAELDLAERQGELVSVAEIDSRLVGLFRRCMTRILGVPSRARQQDPALTAAQIVLIDSLLREALDELAADALDAGDLDEVTVTSHAEAS